MSDKAESWEPGPELAALLYTDFDGMAADPDDVISEGLDGGYAERSSALAAILQDPGADAVGRFLACLALTRWADPVGYATVTDAASSPGSVPWKGASYDRFRGVDDTFGLLAEAVGDSADMVEERGTADGRLAAARALLSSADRVQLDRKVSALLRADLVTACLPEIRSAVERAIGALEADRAVSFDLGLQVALMVQAARRSDPGWADRAAARLTATEPGERALRELAD
ncbi:hypothetical protein [Streptomyces mesophilus]|uniref:hypothetical protein n=1 Tax=Streptomyces mesophilus TaxID=1775132 RepID=UPI003320D5CD